MSILRDYQWDALQKMHNGCILYGGVGSGKSRTSLAYYYIQNGGDLDGPFKVLKNPRPLIVITTARKRDSADWYKEIVPFAIDPKTMTVDSWNNIKKYQNIYGAFFIFDEQRLVGSGAWVKAFYKIAKKNQWILLSATPGDKWSDYIPVFVANGFYRNKTEFCRMHCVYNQHVSFPKIDHYVDTNVLSMYRRKILVPMVFKRDTNRNHITTGCEYDRETYRLMFKERWNFEDNEPFQNAAQLCYHLRKLINSNPSRCKHIVDVVKQRRRVIIFYNYDYELEILRGLPYGSDVKVYEWNGHKHEFLPDSGDAVYLCQYASANEAWNCITTDTMIFFSENYSYKVMEQASGRIDRMNTPYKELYYYHYKTSAPIDLSIDRALRNKKKFNEEAFANGSR